MIRFQELVKLVHDGASAAEILAKYPRDHARLRRLINSRRFRDALALQESLAGVMAMHRTAVNVDRMVQRLGELAAEGTGETARKACLALLNEGLLAMRQGGLAEAQSEPAMMNASKPRMPSIGMPVQVKKVARVRTGVPGEPVSGTTSPVASA